MADAELLQDGCRLLIVDPFGDGLQPEGAGERNERFDEYPVGWIGGQVLDERAVDLDLVDGKRAQVAERRIAGAEVVDRHLAAELLKRIAECHGLIEVVDRRRLGDLDRQPLENLAAAACEPVQRDEPLVIRRREARDIERELYVGVPLHVVHGELLGPPVEHPAEVEPLRHSHEIARRYHGAIGALEPEQAFVAGWPQRLRRNNGVQRQMDAAVAQRLDDLVGDQEIALTVALALCIGLVGDIAAGTSRFGPVERIERAADRLLHRCGMGRNLDAADGDLPEELAGRGLDRLRPHRGEKSLGGDAGRGAVALVEDDAELVRGVAADCVATAQPRLQPLADGLDDLVAGVEAERLVDVGEVADAGDEKCRRPVGRAGALDALLQRVVEADAVELARQGVVVGEEQKPLLLLVALVDDAHDSRDLDRHAIRARDDEAMLFHP